MNAVFGAAGGALFTAAVGIAAGAVILDRFPVKLTGLERWLFRYLTGGAALSLLVFFLTAAHLAYVSVFVAAGFAILAAGLWRSRRQAAAASPGEAIPARWLIFALCLAIPFVELYLCHALGPEYSSDGTAYHLGFVARYLREHRFPVITTDFHASFPEGLEMLFLFAFSIGKHSAAAMTHLLFLFAAAAGLVAYGARFGRARAGIAAAVLLLLAPVAGADATTAYVDAGESCVCFGLFYALQIWRREDDDRMLAIAGILAGFAAAIKYPGFIAPLYALAVVGFTLRKQPKRLRRAVARILLPAALLAAPWLVKNTIEVGNPVSPMANRLFPNPYVHVSLEEDLAARLEHWNGVTWREVPLEATVGGGRLQGIVGPVFLLAPLALLCLGDPLGRPALFALLCFLLPYPANIGTRFLLPALPFLSLTLCLALSRWRSALAGLMVFQFVASQPAVVGRYSQAGVIERRWDETLRTRPEAETLRARVEGYAMARYIDENLPENARVYQIGGFPLAYVTRAVDGYYEGALGERLYYVFFSAVDAFPDWAPTWRRTFHFNATRLERIRIEQTAERSAAVWTISEARLFDRGREIARQPGWRLTTSNFPWDIGFAFDGNLATSWKAWERARPGMFVECEFDGPIEVTDVQVDAPHDQRDTRLAIKGEDADGRAVTLPASVSFEDTPLPAGYRLLVGREFKAQGYTHFTMKHGIPGYEDVRRNPAEWGMRLVAERDGYILCQFE